MKDVLDHVRRRLTGRVARAAPDPFRTLELQARLSRLGKEMETLGGEPAPRFARRHHGQAATRAYDQTLTEACRLAGLPVTQVDSPGDRLLAEASLVQAGWSW